MVLKIFSSSPRLVRNDDIKSKAELAKYIIDNKISKLKSNPSLKVYYITTGNWSNDQNLVGVVESAKRELSDLELFGEIEFNTLDAKDLQKYYHNATNAISQEITFIRKVVMTPADSRVKQAFIGSLPVSEYLKLITDEGGNIRKSLFHQNLRDYLGENNKVNKDMYSTLTNSDTSSKFTILNNGITVVAKQINVSSDQMYISDYQIVNGCQTSHVLFDALKDDTDTEKLSKISVPIKIIETKDEDLIAEIVKSTNSQTEVKKEEFLASAEIQKMIEQYYIASTPMLHYERRSKQYVTSNVEQVKIVTIKDQIRAFASMFLDEPHKAARSYGDLLSDASKNTDKSRESYVFHDKHHPASYYTSGLAHYWIEFLFRTNRISSDYKIFRYYLLMILRYQLEKSPLPSLSSSKIESYCQNIISQISTVNDAHDAFKNAVAFIDSLGIEKPSTRDEVRTQNFTQLIITRIRGKN